MTEHNRMTAKEKFDSRLKQLKSQLQAPEVLNKSRIEAKIEAYNECELIMKEHTLQVATEAVGEEQDEWEFPETKDDAKYMADRILKNIKKRLNDA